MEKIIKFKPAYDKRHEDPNKNYGTHGMDLIFALKGKLGATSFIICTNWHLKYVQDEFDRRSNPDFPHLSCHPQPVDLGYHSPTRVYGFGEPVESCELLDGKSCYCDGSTLNAIDLFDKFVAEGEDIVWKTLEEIYLDQFGKLE